MWILNVSTSTTMRTAIQDFVMKKVEEKRTSGSENLIGCEVAETETAPPKKLLH